MYKKIISGKGPEIQVGVVYENQNYERKNSYNGRAN